MGDSMQRGSGVCDNRPAKTTGGRGARVSDVDSTVSAPNLTLSALPGVRVGHWTHRAAGTGCTVVRFDPAAQAAVVVRGSAPGTRETDALHPGGLAARADALLLTGGSAFGLAAAHGVMQRLEAEGRGFPTTAGPVPIVPAAVIYDLAVGDPAVRPDADAGAAALAAASGQPVPQGAIGAGTGAAVGTGALRVKGGLGSSLGRVGGVLVGALAVVNAAGAVYDPRTGRRVGGGYAGGAASFGQHTTIGVVAVSARLERWQLHKIADMAHDGLARAVRPAHGMFDGDAIFAAAVGDSAVGESESGVDITTLGDAAAAAFADAVLNGVRRARAAYGLRAAAS